MKEKTKKKYFTFTRKGEHDELWVSSYHPKGGIIQTLDGDMHWLINTDRKKLNKLLNKFFKTVKFKEKK